MNKAAAPAKNAAQDPGIASLLLAWYDQHRRDLPWRRAPGEASDPYAVWLSEVMLQQTTVAAVKPYYAAFLSAWPTVSDLASAPLEDVLGAWAGLGYYSRARNLHACARLVAAEHGGLFPSEVAALRGLPGIGSYTAAAIAAIAFGRRAVVVDGNVERVMSRLFAIEVPLPRAKPLLHAAMDGATPDDRAGDFAQATMDLGATICTPRSPACIICPVAPLCEARRRGIAQDLPRKMPKRAVSRRRGAVFMIVRADGALLTRRRPPHGLFGGMMEFPSTPWLDEDHYSPATLDFECATMAGERTLIGHVEHGLTHFTLELDVYLTNAPSTNIGELWVRPDDLVQGGLPTLMRKVLDVYLENSRRTPDGPATSSIADRPFGPEPNGSRRRRKRQTRPSRTGP